MTEASTISLIHEIVKVNARAQLNSTKNIILFLRSWWSKHYNRPLKDPILSEYTLEELMYEYLDKIERQKADDEQSEQESDKIEESKLQEGLSWAEEEERKELEALEASRIAAEEKIKQQEWMDEVLKREREIHGEDFGKDLSLDFQDN